MYVVPNRKNIAGWIRQLRRLHILPYWLLLPCNGTGGYYMPNRFHFTPRIYDLFGLHILPCRLLLPSWSSVTNVPCRNILFRHRCILCEQLYPLRGRYCLFYSRCNRGKYVRLLRRRYVFYSRVFYMHTL